MSVLAKLRAQESPQGKKLFAVVAGPRLGGKTTLAGTLAGKTLLLQAAVLESGSESARALAKKRKADLVVVNFTTIDELSGVLKELQADTEFDHVYVDGLSAVGDLLAKSPKIADATKRNTWDGFRMLGEAASEIILACKDLTYTEKTKKAKNVFLTCALKITQDAGNTDVELEVKGRMAVTAVTKYGEAVLTVLPPNKTETGETGHILLTRSEGPWPGRIDGLLRDQNPGVIEPADLSKVLELRGVK